MKNFTIKLINTFCFYLIIIASSKLAFSQGVLLGFSEMGLSIGNSGQNTGLRINWSDDGIKDINGVNITLWNPGNNSNSTIKGLAIGLVAPDAYEIRGLTIGGWGINAYKVKGLSFNLPYSRNLG